WGGDGGPRVERARPAIDPPFDQERQAGRQYDDRAEGLELREQLLDQQQPAEDQQEDADPRQARSARVIGPPFPGVVANHRLAGSATTAVGPETRHRLLRVI